MILNGSPIKLKNTEIIVINTCFKYHEVFNDSVNVVDLEDGDNKAFCSIIETNFASETAMILETKISTKAASLMVGDISQGQVI